MKTALQKIKFWLIVLISLLCLSQQTFAQYNLVNTEYPPAFTSNFNLDLGLTPMAKCENHIAMESEYHNGGQGIVVIAEYDGTNWVDVASLTASDGDNDDFFRYQIAITDEIIAVTAHNKDGEAVYMLYKQLIKKFKSLNNNKPELRLRSLSHLNVSFQNDMTLCG